MPTPCPTATTVTGQYSPAATGPTPCASAPVGHNVTYQADKHFGASAYTIVVLCLGHQTEIMTYGRGSFTVFEDFLAYKSGVYILTAQGSVAMPLRFWAGVLTTTLTTGSW